MGDDVFCIWIIIKMGSGFSLKYDYCYEDGSDDKLIMYGGYIFDVGFVNV